jgi:soluble lytic murein transglycosylase-like protein
MVVGVLLAFLGLSLGPVSTLAAPPLAEVAAPQAVDPAQTDSATSGVNQDLAGGISRVFQPSIQYWSAAIQGWAAVAGLDPNLVATVMQIESCGDPQALSRAGAMGLFQVMPFHFTTTDDPYDPDTNAARGMAYLKRSLEKAGGDPRLAMAGYNGGIGVISWSESDWAAETQRYAYWGSGIYAEASGAAGESLRLQEWLSAGGASLCRQARSRLGIAP